MKVWLEKARDKTLEIILGLALTAIVGAVVAQAGAIIGLFTGNPLQMAIVVAAAFFLGVVFAYSMGIRDKMKVKAEQKQKEMQATKMAAENKRRAEEARIEKFMDEEPIIKILVAFMHDHGSVDVDTSNNRQISRMNLYGKSERRSGKVRFYPRDWVMEMFDARPDLLEYPRACFEGKEE